MEKSEKVIKLVVKRSPLKELIDELGKPEVVIEFNNWLPEQGGTSEMQTANKEKSLP